jgi:hypothetical protein
MTLSKGFSWIPVVRKKWKNFYSFLNILTLFFFLWSKLLAYMFLFLFRELTTIYKIQILVTHSLNLKFFFLFWLYNFNHLHIDSLSFLFLSSIEHL